MKVIAINIDTDELKSISVPEDAYNISIGHIADVACLCFNSSEIPKETLLNITDGYFIGKGEWRLWKGFMPEITEDERNWYNEKQKELWYGNKG